jgi:enoyl-CoA hydratase
VRRSEHELVRVERGTTPGVWRLLLDRLPVNAFSADLYRAVLAALTRLDAEPALRCLIIGSAVDGVFCAGADTKELAALNAAADDSGQWQSRDALTAEYLRRIQAYPVPTIAAVDGYAVGAGFVLASLCDVVVASRRSWFSIPELAVRRAGGARHAMRVLPQGVVRHLYLAQARLDADRAYQLGFVQELADDGTALSVADRIAERVSTVPAGVLREAKSALGWMEELATAPGVQIERLYSQRMAGLDNDGAQS